MTQATNIATKTSLYNGSITLNFSSSARNRYTIEETRESPVGVTTVLQMLNKPALMTWPLNEALAYIKSKCLVAPGVYGLNDEQLDEASKAYLAKGDKGKDTGTNVHAMIEAFFKKGTAIGETPEAERAFDGFMTWYEKFHPTPLAVEQVLYSKEHNYAGTMDCLLRFGDEIVVCDVKTNNASRTAPLGVYSEHFLQLGAYNLAYREEKATRLHKGLQHNYADEYATDLMIIRVGKDGKVNTLRASQLGLSVRDCEINFLEVLRLYKLLTPLNKRITEETYV